jgi:peptide deformylase
MDMNGDNVEQVHSGLVARIIQHEIEHLDGILYTDKMERCSLRHDSHVGKYAIID